MRTYLSLMIIAITTAFTSNASANLSSFTPAWDEIGLSVFGGVENFRGIPDGHGGNNHGICTGFNAGSPVPGFNQYGLGLQLGGSAAVLDFAGRGRTSRNGKSVQGQEFITAGLFLRALPHMPLSIGVVYDCMFNQNYGVYGEDPTLQQVRGQFAYYVSSCDELGVWGTYDIKKTKQIQRYSFYDYKIAFRPIAQANLFWRHLFGNGVESNVAIGYTLRNRLHRYHSNRAGKYIVGLELSVPFLDSWLLVGKASYMQPGTRRGEQGEMDYASNISINVVYFFGGNPNTSESCAWMPYLPLADNTNFLVDSASKVGKIHLPRY
ncbi:MAG: hypothetical protein H0W50_00880 [Parachlamydiaceae bacterium]|nr:hypothetical protein [Parachlamydiaceae bacterium]